MPPKRREGALQRQKSKSHHTKQSHSPRRAKERLHHQRRSSSSSRSSSSEEQESDAPFLLQFPVKSSYTASVSDAPCDFTNKEKKRIAFTRPLRRSTSPGNTNDHSDNNNNKNNQTHLSRSNNTPTTQKPCFTSTEYVAPHRTRSPTRPPQRKQNERRHRWCIRRKWLWWLAPLLLLLLVLTLLMLPFFPEVVNATEQLWCHPLWHVNITKQWHHLLSNNFSSWLPKWNLMKCSNRPSHIRHPCHCALKSRSKSLLEHFTGAINNNSTNTSLSSSGEQSQNNNNNNSNQIVNFHTLNDRFTSILAGPVGGIRGVHIYQTFPPLLTLERLQELAQRESSSGDNNKEITNLSNFDHESEFDAKSNEQKNRSMLIGRNAAAMVKKLTNKFMKNNDSGTEDVSRELHAKFLEKYSCLQVEEILDVFTSVEEFYNRLRCSFHIHNDNHTESETSNKKSSLSSATKSSSLHSLPSSSELSWSSVQDYFNHLATRINNWYNDHSNSKGKSDNVPVPLPGRCVVWLVPVSSVKEIANSLKELLEDNTLRGNRVVPINSRGVLVLVSPLDRSELRSQLPDRVIHMFTTIS